MLLSQSPSNGNEWFHARATLKGIWMGWYVQFIVGKSYWYFKQQVHYERTTPPFKRIGVVEIIEILTWCSVCDTTFKQKCTHRSIFNFKAARWAALSLTCSGIVQQWSGIDRRLVKGGCDGSNDVINEKNSGCQLMDSAGALWRLIIIISASLIVLITGGCLLWLN